jgi:8-oxo-dGTP pyrophosphatase MutT (NUDIX family)
MDFCRYLYENAHVQEWRNELYPVFQNSLSQTEPIFLVERGCVGYLGLPAYGVHVNGFVRTDEGLKMWIAKRSISRHIAPGKLDQIAAGGLPFGLDPYDNVIKECQEEASIPLSLASKAQYIHTLRYHAEDDRGSKPDYIYVFDLELPSDFIPIANDGEAESFLLLPLSEVLDLATNTLQFKPNCGLVVIDFLVRHQCLPDFLELNQLIV